MKECNIFLAISGATPAVLTEAVWALAVRDGVRLDEFHVVTTPIGKDLLDKVGLFDDKKGPLARMRKDWKTKAKNIPPFPAANAHVPKGMRKRDLSDSDENACMEAEITSQLRRYTVDPSTRLFASLAGGRKPMSAYMILGMTAFARPQDRLYHVLSEAPGGMSPEGWFYPSPKKPGEKKWVNLFEVPFPKLRRTFETHHPELLRTSLTQAFEEFNKAAEEPTIEVNLLDRDRFVTINGVPFKASPRHLMWLSLLVQRKDGRYCPKETMNCGECRTLDCTLKVRASKLKGESNLLILDEKDLSFLKKADELFHEEYPSFEPADAVRALLWASYRARLKKEMEKRFPEMMGFFIGLWGTPGKIGSYRLGVDRKNLTIRGGI